MQGKPLYPQATHFLDRTPERITTKHRTIHTKLSWPNITTQLLHRRRKRHRLRASSSARHIHSHIELHKHRIVHTWALDGYGRNCRTPHGTVTRSFGGGFFDSWIRICPGAARPTRRAAARARRRFAASDAKEAARRQQSSPVSSGCHCFAAVRPGRTPAWLPGELGCCSMAEMSDLPSGGSNVLPSLSSRNPDATHLSTTSTTTSSRSTPRRQSAWNRNVLPPGLLCGVFSTASPYSRICVRTSWYLQFSLNRLHVNSWKTAYAQKVQSTDMY